MKMDWILGDEMKKLQIKPQINKTGGRDYEQ